MLAGLLGCGGSGASSSFAVARWGEPRAALTAEERAQFELGRERFSHVFEVKEGLGPFYNAHSCSQCHGIPALGGVGGPPVLRVGHRDDSGSFTGALGGTWMPEYSIAPDIAVFLIPPSTNVWARRAVTPLFGLGQVEAVADEALIALERARKPWGIRGRAARLEDGHVGRLGWKAQAATLEAFCAVAYRDELGITSPQVPMENEPNGRAALLKQMDTVPDPEAPPGEVEQLAGFIRGLEAPPSTSTRAEARGRAMFERLGCAVCHVATLHTEQGERFHPYSDFLLHEVGVSDGVPQGAAQAEEIRTAPLWGLSARASYLHDGSATSVDEAIRRHKGEAREVTNRYASLGDADREELLHFLNTL